MPLDTSWETLASLAVTVLVTFAVLAVFRLFDIRKGSE
jgi:hypothetical protein